MFLAVWPTGADSEIYSLVVEHYQRRTGKSFELTWMIVQKEGAGDWRPDVSDEGEIRHARIEVVNVEDGISRVDTTRLEPYVQSLYRSTLGMTVSYSRRSVAYSRPISGHDYTVIGTCA